MRIATYNIGSGGFASYSSASDLPERLSDLVQALQEIDADVIGLTDTFRWKEAFTPHQIRQIFGYPYVFYIDMHDTRIDRRIGVALLSRYPLADCRTVRLYNRSAIKASVELSSRVLEVCVIYLDDLSEVTRHKQIGALQAQLSEPAGATIVLGDFNALWPQHVDRTRKRIEEFIAASPTFKERDDFEILRKSFEGLCKARVLPYLERSGFTEPPGLRPTAFTPLHAFAMPRAMFAVDHIVARGCKLVDYRVHTGALFTRASDHYPLSASLE